MACALGEQSLARSPPVAPAQMEALSRPHGLVGNVVPRAQCGCLCRQPLASSVTLVSVLPRAGGPREGRRRRSHLEPGDLMPDFEARGRGRSARKVLQRLRGARSRRCAAHDGARPQDTLIETPARSLPIPWGHSRPSVRQLHLAEQPWLGTLCELVGDPLSEAWQGTGPSPGFWPLCAPLQGIRPLLGGDRRRGLRSGTWLRENMPTRFPLSSL